MAAVRRGTSPPPSHQPTTLASDDTGHVLVRRNSAADRRVSPTTTENGPGRRVSHAGPMTPPAHQRQSGTSGGRRWMSLQRRTGARRPRRCARGASTASAARSAATQRQRVRIGDVRPTGRRSPARPCGPARAAAVEAAEEAAHTRLAGGRVGTRTMVSGRRASAAAVAHRWSGRCGEQLVEALADRPCPPGLVAQHGGGDPSVAVVGGDEPDTGVAAV